MRMFLFLLMLPVMAYAGSGGGGIPQEFDAQFCMSRVNVEGKVLAQNRWGGTSADEQYANLAGNVAYAREHGMEVPEWFVALIAGWIESAYAWEGTPQEWGQSIYNKCKAVES